MRLGGPVYEKFADPEQWVSALKRLDYGAAYCPVDQNASDQLVEQYAAAASAAGIVMAEVGAWSNPLSSDPAEAAKNLQLCRQRLALAEKIGALCCVNIAGSRGAKWDGPDARDLTDDTFDRIVQTVRAIIDAVNPRRTFYTIEPMPWMYPDSADSYLRLLKAIDRRAFAVHLDVVNIVNCPQRYFDNAGLIRECFAKLGPHIRSCHGKDILMADRLTVHLDEVRPGLGTLDYGVFLTELAKLPPDTPLMLEHLPSAEDYTQAAAYVRKVASEQGLSFVGLRR